jgi:hypothetical protein
MEMRWLIQKKRQATGYANQDIQAHNPDAAVPDLA